MYFFSLSFCLFHFMSSFTSLISIANNIPNLYVSSLCSMCSFLHRISPSALFPFLLYLFLPSLLLYSPTPKVSWLRRDGEMSESRTVKDLFDHRLRFSNISEIDGGEYQCIAENSQGKTTHTYTLTVEGMSYTLMHIYMLY